MTGLVVSTVDSFAIGFMIAANIDANRLVMCKTKEHLIAPNHQISSLIVLAARHPWSNWMYQSVNLAQTVSQAVKRLVANVYLVVMPAIKYAIQENAFHVCSQFPYLAAVAETHSTQIVIRAPKSHPIAHVSAKPILIVADTSAAKDAVPANGKHTNVWPQSGS